MSKKYKPNFFLDIIIYISFYFTSLFILIELFKPYIIYWNVCFVLLFVSFIISVFLVIMVEFCED